MTKKRYILNTLGKKILLAIRNSQPRQVDN